MWQRRLLFIRADNGAAEFTFSEMERPSPPRRLCTTTVLLLLAVTAVTALVPATDASTLDLYRNARPGRIVQTRYGRLQGLVLPLDQYKFLRPIEAFLGVPYATPPTNTNR